MKPPRFQLQSGETILYQTHPNRQWYAVIWTVASGLVGTVLLTLLGFSIFSETISGLLAKFLPPEAALLATQVLCLGIVPLLIAAWLTQEVARTFIGNFILTDRRLWTRGSPYAWSQSETPLEEIAAISCRRDAIFVRLKSSRKLQVHMCPDGKEFVKAYEKFVGEP